VGGGFCIGFDRVAEGYSAHGHDASSYLTFVFALGFLFVLFVFTFLWL